MKLKAVIFDMDGVLVDTEPLHMQAFKIFMQELGLQPNEDYVHRFVGYSIDQNIRTINRDFFRGRELEVDSAVRRRDTIYKDLVRKHLKEPIAGIAETVTWCEENQIAMALASSSWRDQVELILDRLEINGFDLRTKLTVIVDGDQVAKRKPAPDIYVKALQKLQAEPQNCLAIEDSLAGIQSARAAGIRVIGLHSPFNKTEQMAQADFQVHSCAEAIKIIKQEIAN